MKKAFAPECRRFDCAPGTILTKGFLQGSDVALETIHLARPGFNLCQVIVERVHLAAQFVEFPRLRHVNRRVKGYEMRLNQGVRKVPEKRHRDTRQTRTKHIRKVTESSRDAILHERDEVAGFSHVIPMRLESVAWQTYPGVTLLNF